MARSARTVSAWCTVRRVFDPGFRSQPRVVWGGIWDSRAEAEEWVGDGERVIEVEVWPKSDDFLFPENDQPEATADVRPRS